VAAWTAGERREERRRPLAGDSLVCMTIMEAVQKLIREGNATDGNPTRAKDVQNYYHINGGPIREDRVIEWAETGTAPPGFARFSR